MSDPVREAEERIAEVLRDWPDDVYDPDVVERAMRSALQALTDLRADVGFLLNTVIWMSGSADFNPSGQAGDGWAERRERVHDILARHVANLDNLTEEASTDG